MGSLFMFLLLQPPALIAPGAEARQLECLPGHVTMNVAGARYLRDTNGVTIQEFEGEISTPEKAVANGPKVLKELSPGCDFNPPPPTANWKLKKTVLWTMKSNGTFESGDLIASWKCKVRSVQAMQNVKSFDLKDGIECDETPTPFELRGGKRVTVSVTECTLGQKAANSGNEESNVTYTFGSKPWVVERVFGKSECYEGFDYRAITSR